MSLLCLLFGHKWKSKTWEISNLSGTKKDVYTYEVPVIETKIEMKQMKFGWGGDWSSKKERKTTLTLFECRRCGCASIDNATDTYHIT